jgi:enoyl-CoA hydratase/carnithine racemase
LFTHVVPAAEVLELSLDIARRIAGQPRHVTAMLKAELSQGRREVLSKAMSREHVMHQRCFARPDTLSFIESSYIEPSPSRAPTSPPTGAVGPST